MSSCERVFMTTDEKSPDQTINPGVVRPSGRKVESTEQQAWHPLKHTVPWSNCCAKNNWEMKKNPISCLRLHSSTFDAVLIIHICLP